MSLTDIANIPEVYGLRVESLLSDPAVIMNARPALSWKLRGGQGCRQTAYQIQAASSLECLLSTPDLWDSGRRNSAQSLYVPWGGVSLNSRQRVFWRVRVWDQDGHESSYSEAARFSIGLMQNADWQASWIHFDGNNPSCSAPCPYFRREFQIRSGLSRATLYISARGLFSARLNGNKISNDEFVPGWTDYHQQLQYLSYDLTDSLQCGANALGVILGDGWYCGYLSGRRRNIYGNFPELLLQLELDYADGTREELLSDGSWKCTTGPILYSDIYDGEMYDERLELPGWDLPGYDDSAWRAAVAGETGAATKAALVAKPCPPVRKIQELKPVARLNPRKDVYIWDFGQNLSGWVRIRLKGYPGRLYTCQFGEMLYPDGTLYNLNYRSARCTNYFTCAGPLEKVSVWEPLFTWQGFRYVQLDGFQFAGASLDDIEMTVIVLHSDLEETSHFQCGHPLLERLFQNIRWGQKSNFLEIPTDCPQRDERLGWTGDAHVFCAAATVNMNVAAFFHKWLRDVREAQCEDGAISCIAPDILNRSFGAAVWADAIIACPWIIYRRFGDVKILEECYPAMQRWVQYQLDTAEDFIRPTTPFGDWLAPDPIETPSALIGTAMLAYGCQTLSRCAEILQLGDAEVQKYRQYREQVCAAFRRTFVGSDHLLTVRNQTSCVLALHFGLLTEEQVLANRKLLAELIRENGCRLSTGFVGTAWLLQTLSEQGHSDLAWELLLQEEWPSWLFSVKQGATTIWERWDSYTLEKGFGNVNMNSFNHYAYGAVLEWIAAKAGGIDYDEAAPGGSKLLFAVEPDQRLHWVDFAIETPYGKAESHWHYENNCFEWTIVVPPNSQGKIILPNICTGRIKLNEKDLDAVVVAKTPRELQVESGTWRLNSELKTENVIGQ